MRFDDGTVYEDQNVFTFSGQCFEHTPPNPTLAPADIAVVDGRVGARTALANLAKARLCAGYGKCRSEPSDYVYASDRASLKEVTAQPPPILRRSDPSRDTKAYNEMGQQLCNSEA